VPPSNAPGQLAHAPRLEVLDGLRGIAVLLVLWYHVWEISWKTIPSWLQFLPEVGFIGVPLFFFLSGFVIAYPFVRWHWGNGTRPSWRDFAWRRFIKIVPSYFLSIAIAYAIGYAQSQQGAASVVQDVVTHALFVHVWFLQSSGTINGVLWTLAVEAQFYLLFPLLWWSFRHAPWVTAGAMIVAALLWRNVLAACCLHHQFPQWQLNLPGYFDIFACGMLSCYIYVRWGKALAQTARRRAVATIAALAGFVWLWELLNGLFAARFNDHWDVVWQIDNRTLLGLSFVLIALGSLAGANWWQRVIANPVLLFFAVISYNLYLYNQIVARELLWHHIPRSATHDPHHDAHWQNAFTWIAFVASTAAGAIVTYAFERPLLKLKGHFQLRESRQSTRNVAS
jgi:peptidoglycan/LPS O-acetylase OafA/YrhL